MDMATVDRDDHVFEEGMVFFVQADLSWARISSRGLGDIGYVERALGEEYQKIFEIPAPIGWSD